MQITRLKMNPQGFKIITTIYFLLFMPNSFGIFLNILQIGRIIHIYYNYVNKVFIKFKFVKRL